jgi:hypothetical protein
VYTIDPTDTKGTISNTPLFSNPDFDIKIQDSGTEEIVDRDRLFINPYNNSNIVYHDESSNCLCEYTILNGKLYDQFDRSYLLGEIISEVVKKTG